ncbi:hypothetical protein [Falsibacillus albus]|uniref:Uncharacterized protein n=1 Tax=Falsibacillus albus TaxID=2478915 RepID=A0A3L7JRN7_9BACI|nr:hypothetical protein [Falsibacillus albus]RLQ93336.1 hypothetical protein D9X91_17900 [Falsibacillus albus]
MKYMTKGKEVILFDRQGNREDAHIVKCLECGTEFRTKFTSDEIHCSSCEKTEGYSEINNGFEVIGQIEDSYRTVTVDGLHTA